jgi:hypothetical protein
MKNIESLITPLVQTQFPEFYQEHGPKFIDFVQQYYAWMETNNQALHVSRSLFDIRDIDKTSDDFVTHFKQKYLNGITFASEADSRLLTKNSLSLYQNKGTGDSVSTTIRALFDQEATIYYPKNDILKSSHGTWVRPLYLELSMSTKTRTLVGHEIIGSITGAKAFAESLVRRRIGTKFIDILYLSDIRGDFTTGELITLSSDTVIDDAPTIVGSMTEVTVVTGGANFKVGDVFTVESENGRQGKARVTEVSNQTGKVNFIFTTPLESGGWGYALDSEVIVSDKVLNVTNITNSNTQITDFSRLETVVQRLANISYTTATPNNAGFAPGTVIENYHANGVVSANAIVVSSSTTNSTAGYIIVAPYSGNIVSVDTTFAIKGNTTTAVVGSYADRTTNAVIVGTNTDFVGVYNITGSVFVKTPYANLVGLTTNTTATIANISIGTDAGFSIGYLTDTESVLLTPDFLYSNNTSNVVFSTINLTGNNSGASLQYGTAQAITGGFAYGGFGFVKYPGSNIDSILFDCLRFDTTTIGSIASLVSINPGNDYNVDPFVAVVEPRVTGYDRHDYLMNITPQTGVFIYGEQIQQTYDLPAVQLTVNNFSGTAANGTPTTTVVVNEFVYQSNATANVAASGYVLEAGISGGAGTIKVANTFGTFVVSGTYKLKSLNTGGTANVSAVAATTYATVARGIVKSGSNTSLLKLKRINLENTFTTGGTVIGRSSGATAIIANIDQDKTTLPVGLNANIVANVQTANGVVTRMAVVDSGFGYIQNETVTLIKEDSPFEVTAIVDLGKQGQGNGYFSSTKGFLDSDKKIHDNDYYQEYSYEVQTKIPFDRYIDVLKQITHVAGTKAFGRVVSISEVDTPISIINSITY